MHHTRIDHALKFKLLSKLCRCLLGCKRDECLSGESVVLRNLIEEEALSAGEKPWQKMNIKAYVGACPVGCIYERQRSVHSSHYAWLCDTQVLLPWLAF